MSDRLLNDNEIQESEILDDVVKKQSISKHNQDIIVMKNLIYSINEYIIRFGRTSNIHDELMDIKAQIKKNKEHIENWIDQI